MKKAILVWSLICSMFLFSSCSFLGHNSRLKMLMGEEQMEHDRAEQIVSVIQQRDQAALRALFSEKVLNDTPALDDDIRTLFDFIQGDILSWKREGSSSEQHIEYGKRTLLLLFEIYIHTDQDDYCLFVFDYHVDTIQPENEGVYQIEASKQSYSGEWEPVDDRMHGGIDIYE